MRSIFERKYMECVGTSVRSFFLLVPMIGGFIAYPLFIMNEAITLLVQGIDAQESTSSSEATSTTRLLQAAAATANPTETKDDLEKTLEEIDLIKIWILSVIAILLFVTVIYIIPFMY